MTLTRDVECNGNFFPEVRPPLPHRRTHPGEVGLEDIQVGDLVGGCFLSDTVEAGDPPTVWVVSFGLENWTMTGELLDYSEDFFLVKPSTPTGWSRKRRRSMSPAPAPTTAPTWRTPRWHVPLL